ncbi:MAG TPA: hypothetical protein VFF49_03660 [Thermodesulfobacteriota bacterium]|nr:hypothetical protein [Thermodesulfobacteriota bacterium]
MSVEKLNPSTIRKLGLEALAKALGPIGMVRFLQQFETGVGDYTKERALWLKDTDVKTIVEEIKDQRKKK